MKVGILSESTATDDEILIGLLEGLLGHPIQRIPRLAREGGRRSVVMTLRVRLADFVREGAALAVVVMDRDESPDHSIDHEAEPARHADCCRCNLVIASSVGGDGKSLGIPVVVGVPAPAIEAWLLPVKRSEFEAPEREDRRRLKILCYGTPNPSSRRVCDRGGPLARSLGADPDVRERVRAACPSFDAFLRSLASALASLPGPDASPPAQAPPAHHEGGGGP